MVVLCVVPVYPLSSRHLFLYRTKETKKYPAGKWLFFPCECRVLIQVEESETGRSLVQGSPTECKCVLVCGPMQQ